MHPKPTPFAYHFPDNLPTEPTELASIMQVSEAGQEKKMGIQRCPEDMAASPAFHKLYSGKNACILEIYLLPSSKTLVELNALEGRSDQDVWPFGL